MAVTAAHPTRSSWPPRRRYFVATRSSYDDHFYINSWRQGNKHARATRGGGKGEVMGRGMAAAGLGRRRARTGRMAVGKDAKCRSRRVPLVTDRRGLDGLKGGRRIEGRRGGRRGGETDEEAEKRMERRRDG